MTLNSEEKDRLDVIKVAVENGLAPGATDIFWVEPNEALAILRELDDRGWMLIKKKEFYNLKKSLEDYWFLVGNLSS